MLGRNRLISAKPCSRPLRRGGQTNLPGCRPPQHAPGRKRGLLLHNQPVDARYCLRLTANCGLNSALSALDPDPVIPHDLRSRLLLAKADMPISGSSLEPVDDGNWVMGWTPPGGIDVP